MAVAKVGRERRKGLVDLGGDAVGVGAGAVGVEVFVDVVDEVGGAAVGVLDGGEEGGGTRGEGGCGGVVGAGEEDDLGSGAGVADGGYGGLDGGGPCGHIGNCW